LVFVARSRGEEGVETGLFIGMVNTAYIGTPENFEVIRRAKP